MTDSLTDQSFSREMRKATRKIHKISDDLVNAKVAFGKNVKLLVFTKNIKFNKNYTYFHSNISNV